MLGSIVAFYIITSLMVRIDTRYMGVCGER
jgi:hypothetical protein